MSCTHAAKEMNEGWAERVEKVEKLFWEISNELSGGIFQSKKPSAFGNEIGVEFQDSGSGVRISLFTQDGCMNITLSLADEQMMNPLKQKAFEHGEQNIPSIISGENLGNSEQIRQRAQAIAAQIRDVIRDVNRAV